MERKHPHPPRGEAKKRQANLSENKHGESKEHSPGNPSPLIDKVKSDPTRPPRNEKNDQSDSSETQRFQRRYLWTQWLLVSITLSYCLVSFAQWVELDKSNQNAKDSLVVSQRAWLAISAIEHKLPAAGEIFQLGLANVGHTPARNVTIFAGSKIGAGEPNMRDIGNHAPKIPCSVTTVGAGITDILPVDFVNLTPEQFQEAKQGRLAVYIFGEFTYRDIFPGSPTRHLQFCNYFQASSSSWAACSSGNDAD